jgi:hypothetical protein
LLKTLHLAKVTGATLLIAKLDRLSCNAAFLMALREGGVEFVAADMLDAKDFIVGIMALVAEQERQAISTRIREALKAAKERGVVAGSPNGTEALRRPSRGSAASVGAIKRVADDHARDLQPVIDDPRSRGGVTGLGSLAAALNGKGILTSRGARRHKTSVRNLLDRQAASHGRRYC